MSLFLLFMTIATAIICLAITMAIIEDIQKRGLRVGHILIMIVGLPVTLVGFIIIALKKPYIKFTEFLDKPVGKKR